MTIGGPQFLQIPGPTNLPDRILRAMARPPIDQRGPKFAELALELIDGMKAIFRTAQPVVIYPSSGTGAWEAALVNTLSPGDRVLAFDIGLFSSKWAAMAAAFGLETEVVETDWRSAIDPAVVAERLGNDRAHAIKAVLMVHNETATGVKSVVPDIRRAIDIIKHPALLLVDTRRYRVSAGIKMPHFLVGEPPNSA